MSATANPFAGIRFRHFHKRGRLRATIATLRVGDQIMVALARCSPEDKPDRAFGRTIAAGRLVLGNCVTLPLDTFKRRLHDGSLISALVNPNPCKLFDARTETAPRFRPGDRVKVTDAFNRAFPALYHEHEGKKGTVLPDYRIQWDNGKRFYYYGSLSPEFFVHVNE